MRTGLLKPALDNGTRCGARGLRTARIFALSLTRRIDSVLVHLWRFLKGSSAILKCDLTVAAGASFAIVSKEGDITDA